MVLSSKKGLQARKKDFRSQGKGLQIRKRTSEFLHNSSNADLASTSGLSPRSFSSAKASVPGTGAPNGEPFRRALAGQRPRPDLQATTSAADLL